MPKKRARTSSSFRRLFAFALATTFAVSGCRGDRGGSDSPPNLPDFEEPVLSESGAGVPFVGGASPDSFIDPTTPVGSLDFQISTAASGALELSWALPTPPGRAGLKPDLGVSYSSHNGQGSLGMGWRIGGSSRISRCPGKVRAYVPGGTDGFIPSYSDSLDPTIENTLCLDGALLVPQNAAGTEFLVEGEPKLRVTAVFDNGLNHETGYFVVDLPNGNSRTYGVHPHSGVTSENARVVAGDDPEATGDRQRSRAWMLASEHDRNGHHILYTYSTEEIELETGPHSRNHRLSSIAYGGGRIDFGYSGEPVTGDIRAEDNRFHFWHGAATLDNQYLKSIDVSGPAGGVRSRYEFEYERSVVSGDPLLVAAKQCDREGVCAPPTRFEYTTDDDGVDEIQVEGDGAGGLVLSDFERDHIVVADFNGDGRDDFVYTSDDPEVGLPSDPVPNQVLKVVLSDPAGNYAGPFQVTQEMDGGYASAADVDGDGLAELLAIVPLAEVQATQVISFDIQEDGSWVSDTVATIGQHGEGVFEGIPHPLAGPEANCEWFPDPWGEQHYFCYREQPLEFAFFDYDGDGADNVVACTMTMRTATSLTVENDSEAYWRDVTGWSSGTLVPSPLFDVPCGEECEGEECERRASWEILDVTADGRPDLLQAVPLVDRGIDGLENAGASEYYAFGAGLPQAGQPANLPFDSFQRYNNDGVPYGGGRDKKADVNGDGLVDLVRFEPQPQNGAPGELASSWSHHKHFFFACDPDAPGPSLPPDPPDAEAVVYLNQGDGHFLRSQYEMASFDAWEDLCDEFDHILVADYNGDRLEDLLIPRQGGSAYEAHLSRGAVDFSEQVTTAWHTPSDASGETTIGQAFDAFGLGRGGSLYVSEEDDEVHVSGYGQPVDLLARMTDGIGRTVEFSHGSLAEPELFSATDCPNDLEALALRRPLLRQVRRPFVGGARLERHHYAGMCANPPYLVPATFERHTVSLGKEIASSEAFYRRTIEIRDDYTVEDENAVYRNRLRRRETYDWLEQEARFRQAGTDYRYTYADDFILGSLIDVSGVPTGAVVQTGTDRYVTEALGYCDGLGQPVDVEAGAPCTPTSAVEEISWSSSETTALNAFGEPLLRAERSGELCREVEVEYLYPEHSSVLEWTEVRPGRVLPGNTNGSGGPDPYDCELDAPDMFEHADFGWNVANPFQLSERIQQPGDPSMARRTTYGYTAGLVTSVTVSPEATAGGAGAPFGARTWDFGFDNAGIFLESETNPEQHTTEFRYHPDLGLLLESTDPNGVVSAFRYDGFGRPTWTGNVVVLDGNPVLGPSTSTSYERLDAGGPDAPSRLRRVETVDGGGSGLVEYDVQRRPVYDEWDARQGVRAFSQTIYSEELDGFRVLQNLPAFVGATTDGTSEAEYDVLGRTIRTKSAADEIDETLYSYVGRESVVHQPSQDLTTRYDLGGRVVETIDGAGTSACMSWSPSGLIENVAVNPVGGCGGALGVPGRDRVESSLAYDALGNMVRQERAGLAPKTAEYNAFGELWRLTDSDGATSVQRDGLGRMIHRVDPDGTSAEFEWDSDDDCTWADGLLRSHSISSGPTKRFDYDRFGRVRATQMELSGETLDTRFSYDEYGRLVDTRLPDAGPVASRRYDGAGFLASIELDGMPVWTATGGSPSGRLTAEQFGNGVSTVRTFSQGLLREYETTAPNMTPPFPGAGTSMSMIDSLEIGYDGDGRVDHRGVPHLGLSEDYTYDAAGRLDSGLARENGTVVADWQQSYSPIGAIVDRTGVGSYVYNDVDAPLAASTVGGVSYDFDTEGRQRLRHNHTLSWNPRDKLLSVTKEGPVAEFEYDAFDERVRKVEHGTTVRDTAYFGGLERRTEGSTTTWNYYVQGESGPVALARRTQQGSNAETWETFFLHSDNLGSSTIVSDSAGAVVQRQAYDPFGRERGELWGAPSSQQNLAEVDIGFTGHRKVESFGLLDMGGRFYDPHAGRFASPDPYVIDPYDSQAHDPYSYVLNDPLRLVDPSGYLAAPAQESDLVFEDLHVDGDVPEEWDGGEFVGPPAPAEPANTGTGAGFSDGLMSDWYEAPPEPVSMPDVSDPSALDQTFFPRVELPRIFAPPPPGFRDHPQSLDGARQWAQDRLNTPNDLESISQTFNRAFDAYSRGERELGDDLFLHGLDQIATAGVGPGPVGPKGPSGGRNKNNLRPHPDAEGPHTSFRRGKGGKISNYETYKRSDPRNPNPFTSEKRVDMEGDRHFNKATQEYVSTPHVQAKDIPGRVRPARPDELPK